MALSENRLIYVKFGHIGFKEKEVFEIPFSNIKSLTVKRILNYRLVKVSFISNKGKLEIKKFYFSTFMLGKKSKGYNESSKQIYDKLVEVQKVLDRGDF